MAPRFDWRLGEAFMKRHIAALALASVLVAGGMSLAQASPPETTIREYDASDEVIANPERGFYHHTETHYRPDGSGYVPLDPEQLRSWRQEQQITQILRVFYLEKFVGSDLDAEYLDLVRADFQAAREAGVKVIVRFAYAQPRDAWPYQPPYGDAPKEVVLRHIDQLAPVLRDNSDVIAVVQAGFIGLWGEWYYTDHFVADPSNPGDVTEADWANRREVVVALLDALPRDRMIQVRTMLMKQTFFDRPTGTEGGLRSDEAFSGDPVARVGHHNDCFLASPDDFGTFLSDPISLDQNYLAQDTQFVPMGGETCTVNPPRSEWPTASAEMERYHYSYLNTDYNQDVLDSWGDEIVVAERRLGYRFRLTQGEFGTSARPGSSFLVDLELRNDGWASPYNPRDVELVLRGDHRSYAVEIPTDPRRWAAGETIDLSAEVCAAVPPGRYDLLLNLPAPERSLSSHSSYAIRLANTGTWEPATGYNDLGHTVVVGPDQPRTGSCAQALYPRPIRP